MVRYRCVFLAVFALGFAVAIPVRQAVASGGAQAVAAQGRGRRGGGLGSAFPQRPPQDPGAVERGKTLFGVRCGFCHGSDARGATTGSNLWRSAVVLMDKNGESIGECFALPDDDQAR